MKENEFNLNSATKYEDGEPIMSDMPVQLVRLTKRVAFLEKKISNTAYSIRKEFDDALDDALDEKMKAVADKYIDLEERIAICEGNIENIDYRLEEIERKMGNILIALRYLELSYLDTDSVTLHAGSNFCGNCTHCHRGKQGDDEVYVCELSHEILDPDDSNCAMFEPPF